MNLLNARLMRRHFLLAPLAGGLAALFSAGTRSARAQEKASLIARSVERLPDTPDDAVWASAEELIIPLAPQVVVKPRLYEASVTTLSVRALYDGDRLSFLLRWPDSGANTELGGVQEFRDAVAIEFPTDPANGIPYFAMGEPGKPVTIYQWKADWQSGRDFDAGHRNEAMIDDWYPFSGRRPGEIAEIADYGAGGDKTFLTSWSTRNPLGDYDLQARTPVEKLQAEGFGSLTSAPGEGQDATGAGAPKDGMWQVVISLPRDQGGFRMERGMTLPLAFAVWDGARAERGGEKAVSTWYFVNLEQPVGTSLYWAPLLAAAGIVAAQFGGLRVLRRAASRSAKKETADHDASA